MTELPVPITGQGTSSIYIRWILTSNTNTAGGTLDNHGVSMIDNILVTAVSTLGVNEILYTNQVTVAPNPTEGMFRISTRVPAERISIYAMNGTKVYETFATQQTTSLNLDLPSGLYLVKVQLKGSDDVYTTRVIIN